MAREWSQWSGRAKLDSAMMIMIDKVHQVARVRQSVSSQHSATAELRFKDERREMRFVSFVHASPMKAHTNVDNALLGPILGIFRLTNM